MKKRVLVLAVCAFWTWPSVFAQQAVVKEQPKTMKSYPFSDPSPVASPICIILISVLMVLRLKE